jgi:hypothetical protein
MTSISPDAQRIWRAARMPAVVGLVIVAVSVILVLARDSGTGGALDPDSAIPQGSRAVAHLLEAEGVRIVRVETAEEALNALSGPSTLLVTVPDWVLPDQLKRLQARASDVVMVGAGNAAVEAVAPSVAVLTTRSVRPEEPGCSLDAARAAGVATVGGLAYAGGTECYQGTLSQSDRTTLVGGPAPLTNQSLDEEGNAALSMRLLGKHERLVWYLPSLSDPALRADQRPLVDLIPDGWVFGAIQVAVAVLLFALWRGRRLGPIVAEPLPVVVRAAETTEGRARLYRRVGASDHAAGTLRYAVIGRLLPALGLPVDAAPAAVVDRVVELTGRPGPEVHHLLYGPPPAGDAALVQLADALDRLENDVRGT